jgi:serine/threonine-protein kinase
MDGRAPEEAAPRPIGRYVLYGEIASGGMASVHFGQIVGPVGFSRPVAIKRLHAHLAKDPEFVTMFLDEARLAARVIHPNVVATLDVVALASELFLVMEYVRGLPLSGLLRAARNHGGRIPPRIVVNIMCGVLNGLHAAHEAKNEQGKPLEIVHRDVSPQNVLVGSDGVARVLDFGVAKAAGRMQTTRDGQLKGKLAYMAPEQIRAGPVTRRTDIYAAAVVLWELLTGDRLFEAENEAQAVANVMLGKVPRPSEIVMDLPLAFDGVVMRAIDPEPSNRYATAREMSAELALCAPGASLGDVSEWVESVAGPEIERRAARIAEIEKHAPTSASSLRELATGLVSAERSSVTQAASPKALASPDSSGRTPASDVESQVSRVAWTARFFSTRSRPRMILGFVLAFGGVCAGWASAHFIGATPAAAVTLPGVGKALTPIPPSAADPPPVSSAATSAASTVPPSIPVTSLPRSVPTHAPVITAPPHSTVKPGCNPPFTTDEHGRTHFKAECL